jgi:hopene-associated glycosyltransferase HpnB
LFRGGFWRFRERIALRAPEFESAQSAVRVAAVIPARDEAAHIATVIGSLRRQIFSGSLSITVADDESSDGTAALAESAGADQVGAVPPRPPGWKGKLWALHAGIAAVETAPDFLLLTDADIDYVSPGALASLVAKAEGDFDGSGGFDLVSVMVQLHAESLAEKLLIPAFVFFFFQLYPPRWVSASGPTAAAAGGVMLLRPQALAKAGGFEAIHDALIDDCALARRVKRSGGRVWLGVSDPQIRSVRGYGGIGGIRSMIARSAFAQLHHSFWLLLATLAGMLATFVAPIALLFAGDPYAALGGAGSLLLMAFLFRPAVKAYDAPWWVTLCLPAIALFYCAATVESAVRYWSGSGGVWKGRVQDSHAHRGTDQRP